MKTFLALSCLLLASSSLRADTLFDLYENLDQSDKVTLEKELIDNNLNTSDLKNVSVSLTTESDTKANVALTLNDDCDCLYDEPKMKNIFRIGAGYLFPFGPSMSFSYLLVNNIKQRKIMNIELELASGMKFNHGTTNSLMLKGNFYATKFGTYIGPIFQMINVYNPGLTEQKMFYYPATGINIGQDFRINTTQFSVSAFGTIGGLRNNPQPFYLLGGSLKVNFTLKKKGKYDPYLGY